MQSIRVARRRRLVDVVELHHLVLEAEHGAGIDVQREVKVDGAAARVDARCQHVVDGGTLGQPGVPLGKLRGKLVRHALAMVVRGAAVGVVAPRRHVHTHGEEQLVGVGKEGFVSSADEVCRCEGPVGTLWVPAIDVDAVAAEEHAEALRRLRRLPASDAWCERLEEGKPERDAPDAAQEAPAIYLTSLGAVGHGFISRDARAPNSGALAMLTTSSSIASSGSERRRSQGSSWTFKDRPSANSSHLPV